MRTTACFTRPTEENDAWKHALRVGRLDDLVGVEVADRLVEEGPLAVGVEEFERDGVGDVEILVDRPVGQLHFEDAGGEVVADGSDQAGLDGAAFHGKSPGAKRAGRAWRRPI